MRSIAHRQTGDFARRVERRASQLRGRHQSCRHSTDHAHADCDSPRIGSNSDFYVAGCNHRKLACLAYRTGRADGMAIACFQLEALGHRRSNGQRSHRSIACRALPARQSTIGCDPKRKRVSSNQTLDRFGGGSRLVLGAAFQRLIGLLDSAFSKPGEHDPDREQDRGQYEEELCRRRQTRKVFGRAHRAARELLAELPDKVEEVVRDGLAQGVVVNRPKRATQVAFPSCAFGGFGLLRVPGMTGSLRLASLLRTQLLIPLNAGCSRAHTNLSNGCNGFAYPAPLRNITSRPPRG